MKTENIISTRHPKRCKSTISSIKVSILLTQITRMQHKLVKKLIYKDFRNNKYAKLVRLSLLDLCRAKRSTFDPKSDL